MNLEEYSLGMRNIHHSPQLKSTITDIPGSSMEFIDYGDVGPIPNGFAMGKETEFEYSRNNDYNDEYEVQEFAMNIDAIIEVGIKENLSYLQINNLIEAAKKDIKKGSPVTNGTDKEGEIKHDADFTRYPPDKFIKEGLKAGYTYGEILKIYETVADGSITHTYPYEKERHVDAEKAIKTPWPQAHLHSEPKPGAKQEFRSPPKNSKAMTDGKDPGKGKKEESIIANALSLGLNYTEVSTILETVGGRNYGSNKNGTKTHGNKNNAPSDRATPQSANIDYNDEKDTDNSPIGSMEDAKKGLNHQIEKEKKVKGGYENIGSKKNGSKKHGVTTKKKADAQRKAMFAHRKPGASWGK